MLCAKHEEKRFFSSITSPRQDIIANRKIYPVVFNQKSFYKISIYVDTQHAILANASNLKIIKLYCAMME